MDQYAKEVEILSVYIIICVTGTFGIALLMVQTMSRAGRFRSTSGAENKTPVVLHVHQAKVGRVCCPEKHTEHTHSPHNGQAQHTQSHQTSAVAVDDMADERSSKLESSFDSQHQEGPVMDMATMAWPEKNNGSSLQEASGEQVEAHPSQE